MVLVHITLGALSSIFGAHLSWAAMGWIMERKRNGHPVFWPTVMCVGLVVVTAVALAVVLANREGLSG